MKNWYVLNTKPKKELQVEKLFREGGFQVYNPKYRDENRIKSFFPSYEFVCFDFPLQYQLVKYTRGVKRVVGNREGPIPVPDRVLNEIRSREVAGLIEFEKYGAEPDPGDEIEVVEGPLKGLKGIFQKQVDEKQRVLILLNYVSYQGQLLIEKRKLRKVQK